MNGYIFKFERGAYSPDGRMPEMSDVEIKEHNSRLATAEIDAAKQTGKALFYEREIGDKMHIGTWEGSFNFPVHQTRKSWHNMAGKDGRRDYYFIGPDGNHWHGVNIGDNQIVRSHRLKH